MLWLSTGLLALLVALLGVLVRPWARGRRAALEATAGPLPAVAVVVPFRGSADDVERTLRSLIAQDHPDFQIVAVTEGDSEPAAHAVRSFLDSSAGRPGPLVRHVMAGAATGCGQKNRNLIAGVHAAGPGRPVLAFIDGGRVAPPCWLRALTAPLVSEDRRIVTGYHHLVLDRPDPASVGRAVTVAFLRSLQAWPRLRQPWGGSLAIPRRLFDELNVAGLWERHVVDDVSLARLVRRAGVPVVAAPGEADLGTPLPAASLAGWTDWLTRQIQFIRFYFPFAWLMGGALGTVLAALLVWTPVQFIVAACGHGSAGPPLANLALTGVLALWLEALRRRERAPVPRRTWMAAGFAAIGVAVGCFARSVGSAALRWQGRVYRVTRGGGVRDITLEPASR